MKHTLCPIPAHEPDCGRSPAAADGRAAAAATGDRSRSLPVWFKGARRATSSRWSLLVLACGLVSAAEPQMVFEDRFDSKLADGWTWLRENPEAWRIREGALEIHIQPGDANSVKNALVRKAPDRRQGQFAIEVTVTNAKKPIRQFEQAGITWYHDGKPVFKLVKELVDGQLMIIPGRKPMTNDSVQLRLLVTADSWTAQFRPGGQGEFQTAETGKLPAPGDDQLSLQCYHGPTEAEHWIRFDDFRIQKLAD